MAKLFNTLRWLRVYNSKKGQQVFIRVRMRSGKEIEIPVYYFFENQRIPISVRSEHWKKGYVTGGKYHIPSRDLNNLLAKVESDVKDAVEELIRNKIQLNRQNILNLTYINEINAAENERKISEGIITVDEQGGAFASESEFVDYVQESDDPKFDTLKKKMGIYKKSYILDFWDDFINKYAPNSYNSPRKSIQNYIEKTGDNCLAEIYSEDWLKRFFDYIVLNGYSWRKDGENRKDYTITTIAKYRKHLISFGDYLFFDLKLLKNQNYKLFVFKEKTKKKSLVKYKSIPYNRTHALYKEEFDLFYFFEFREEDLKLEIARDMFVLQTWLGGLRISDFLRIDSNNFHKDLDGNYFVEFVQQKTKGDVHNQVSSNYLRPLIDKYLNKSNSFLSSHEYNKKLKSAAEKAGLDRKLMFRYEYVKRSEPKTEWIPIFEKISNTWARNCAVSILCELGYPSKFISNFVGHKDERMINHYLMIHNKDVNKMLEEVKPLNPNKIS